MKKLIVYVVATFLSVAFIPGQTHATTTTTATSTTTSTSADAKEADALVTRLEVIKSMDKADLSFSEKRTLRKEVRTIKERLADIGGGVYISVGALILIIVLLLILL